MNVMLVIERTRTCRVNGIATALSITVGGASQAVDRLEKHGHCARRPSLFGLSPDPGVQERMSR
jgi:DNA-binding MarR family transcriptional regulator